MQVPHGEGKTHPTSLGGYNPLADPMRTETETPVGHDTFASHNSSEVARYTQDARQPTPKGTQTPIRLRLGTSGEEYLIDNDGHIPEPFSRLDSEPAVVARDFSTQTFGQLLNHPSNHAACQTDRAGLLGIEVEEDATQTTLQWRASQQSDEDAQTDIFNDSRKQKDKKKKDKKKSKSKKDDVSEQGTEEKGNKRDILKYMLSQVRDLKNKTKS